MSSWFRVAPTTAIDEEQRGEHSFIRRNRPRNLGEFLRPVEASNRPAQPSVPSQPPGQPVW